MSLHSRMKVLLALRMGALLVNARRMSLEPRQAQVDESGDSQSISGGLHFKGSSFSCPKACKQCCMSPASGFHFECYFRPLFAPRANMFSELAGYPCNRSEDMEKDGDIFTVCALNDDSYPGQIHDHLRKIEKLKAGLDKKFNLLSLALQHARIDPLREEIAKVVSDMEELRTAKEGSSKIFTDLNAEILMLQNTLLLGATPAPQENKAALLQTGAASLACMPVSAAGPLLLKQKSAEVDQMNTEIEEMRADVAKAKAAQRNSQSVAMERLQKAEAEYQALLNDPDMQDISAKIASLKERRQRLQQLIDKGFPALGYQLRQLKIAATRNADFVQLLLRLRSSENGNAGVDRQQAFEQHVAPHAGNKLKDDEARLKSFCNSKQKNDSSFACSSKKIREYFKGLNKEVSTWQGSYSAVVDGVQKGQNLDDLNPDAVLEIIPRVQAKVVELGDLITSWQLENPLRFNEPLWMTYMNWVEDSESAVRVYLKVTNRELTKDNPSNSLIACAEQRDKLEYQPDRMVRIGECSEQPPWEVKWNSTVKACSAHDAWDDQHEDRTFGPFFGVYASSDAKGERGMEHNIPNEDVYGYSKNTNDDFEWAPHMRSVLRQAQSGYTIVLFGYGYSGTGKTYTLLGKGKTPGVMTLGLQEMQESIMRIQVRFKELYGQISLEDGRPEVGETGLYSYKIATGDDAMPIADSMCPGGSDMDCVEYKFWGRSDAKEEGWDPKDLFVPPASDRSNPPNYKPQPDEVTHLGFADFLEMPEHTIELNKSKIAKAGHTIGEWLQSALGAIQRTRERQRCRKIDCKESCRHVRATPNNPESSRGHLFTMLDVTFKAHLDDENQEDKIGKIVIVDCAGSEDPVSIMKDYVDFAADGEDPTIGDMRAMTYLKEYDRKLAGKLKLWNSHEIDDVIPGKKKRTWLKEAATLWARKLPADVTVGNPNAGGMEGVDWKIFKKGEKYEPLGTKSQSAKDDDLLKIWSEKYLLGAGIISMVKEGVFINESLNHLKQFLLRRSGRIQSLMQIVKPDGLKEITDDGLKVPGTSEPALPLINDWDFDKADEPKYFADGRPNKQYDAIASSYHPKQFIKPWNIRRVGSTNFKPKEDAANTESLLGASRCSYSWESDPIALDQEGRPFSCDHLVVDGVRAQRKHLTVGAIPRFDPVMMISMLNYFDHPEYFGKSRNIKPTKFLMIAAVRREHPEDDSAVPPEYSPKKFKRLKRNICMGAEMSLQFADEMNPLSKNNRLSVS